jgi:hypothetical protein
MRDAHTALADATATLQVQCLEMCSMSRYTWTAPLFIAPPSGLILARSLNICIDLDPCAGLQVLLGQLRYFPGLANTVPALHDLCLAAPNVLRAVHPEL